MEGREVRRSLDSCLYLDLRGHFLVVFFHVTTIQLWLFAVHSICCGLTRCLLRQRCHLVVFRTHFAPFFLAIPAPTEPKLSPFVLA